MKLSYIQNYIVEAIAADKAEQLDWAGTEAVREAFNPLELVTDYLDRVKRETATQAKPDGDVEHHLSGLGLSAVDWSNCDILEVGFKSGLINHHSTENEKDGFLSNWFAMLADEIKFMSRK